MIASILRRCASWTVALVLLTSAGALADSRVALVIGNSAYQHAGNLPNPVNDAKSVAELLRTSGFDVVQARTDIGNLEFKRAIREFSETARSADIAVVFFAGHGIEVGGINYLVPIDARLAKDVDAEDEAVPLDRLIRALEPARRLRLIILDACRDNPFAKTIQRLVSSRAVTNGLAKVEPAGSDTLIAYAAKAGSIAADGTSAHSPFTAALLKHVAEPGLDIRLAFGRVRDDVLKTTANKQEPFLYGSLGGTSISLVPAPVEPKKPSVADIRTDYELAERVGTRASWESFLNAYPAGFYSDLARAQLAKLGEEARRLDAERAAQERLAREQAERQRLDTERLTREQAAKERLAREQAEADRPSRERAERQPSEQERIVREQNDQAGRKPPAQQIAQQAGRGDAARVGETHDATPETQVPPSTNMQTAAVTPAPEAAPPPALLAGSALVRAIKKELKRVGCYAGRIDGNWGADEVNSLRNFGKYARLVSTPGEPDLELLYTLRGPAGRICPLDCGTREIERNGRCMAKSCPGGYLLNDDGACERRRQRVVSRPPEVRRSHAGPIAPYAIRQPKEKSSEGEHQVRCGKFGCENFVRSKQLSNNCLSPQRPGQTSFLCRR